MSGSGGGGGGAWAPTARSCSTLIFDTQISSPRMAVLTGVQVDETLTVSLMDFGGTSVVVVLRGNQVAGGIASPLVAFLQECILGGTNYVAVVAAVNNAQVRVRISPL